MESIVTKTIKEMIKYYTGDARRVNHFIKVHNYARQIALGEGLDEGLIERIELAAAVHDIGIKVSEEKYDSSSGKYQEIEGPALAKKLLTSLGCPNEEVERICFLVGNHHSYEKIDNIDFQILIEADFLVNIYEDQLKHDTVLNIKDMYFKTETGHEILDCLFLN